MAEILWTILILGKQGFARLLDEECRPRYMNAIIGGRDANPYPWMAYITEYGHFKCGGSLIANRFVLTARHCLGPLENFIVRLGEYDTLITTDGPHEDFGVTQAFAHPTADIAILKLDRSVEYKANIKPICIIMDSGMEAEVNAISSLTVTGWGRLEGHTWRMATRLQEATVQRMHPSLCDFPIGEICCRNPTEFVCHGDSGSLLAANIKYKGVTIYAQVGVVSRGETDICDANTYYVDVMYYNNWIRSTILGY